MLHPQLRAAMLLGFHDSTLLRLGEAYTAVAPICRAGLVSVFCDDVPLAQSLDSCTTVRELRGDPAVTVVRGLRSEQDTRRRRQSSTTRPARKGISRGGVPDPSHFGVASQRTSQSSLGYSVPKMALNSSRIRKYVGSDPPHVVA